MIGIPNLSSRFEYIKELGKGGCGTVYLVKDTKNNNNKVALKVLTGLNSIDKYTKERFIKEALTLCSIDHKNIVKGYELLELDGSIGYLMEYIEGSDLNFYFETGRVRTLTSQEIISIIRQTLLGLSELHKRGIIHRDIKPENIMITKEGLVKINDLGFQKFINDDSKTDPGTILGSVFNIAPEYFDKKKLDQRADIYACGLMLWEFLNKDRRTEPDLTTGIQILNRLSQNKFRHPKLKLNGEFKIFEKVLEKSLVPNPDKRYANTEEMLEELYEPVYSGRIKSEMLNAGVAIEQKSRMPVVYSVFFLTLLVLLIGMVSYEYLW